MLAVFLGHGSTTGGTVTGGGGGDSHAAKNNKGMSRSSFIEPLRNALRHIPKTLPQTSILHGRNTP